VALAVLAAGAHIINDESGGNAAMAQAVATYGAPVILMHRPAGKPTYQQVSSDVMASLRETIALYESFGVERQSMMVDPGLGFGKSHEDNIAVLAHLDLLHDLDLPILVGASRKSFIGKVTGEVEPANRLSGSLAVAVWCAVQQIQIVRVHDVAATVQALAMVQAMMKG
jgi:dihydropteroate synthase